MEVSSSPRKSKSNGLTQKQRDILEVVKDDPAIRQIFLQKLHDNDLRYDNYSQPSLLQNPELKIFRIHKILTICDQKKIQNTKEKSSQRSWPLVKVRAITINNILLYKLRENCWQALFTTVPRHSTLHLQYRQVTIHEQSQGKKFQKEHRTKRLPFEY